MWGHQGYINRKNRFWNPRTEPTPRQLDLLREWDRQEVPTQTKAAKALGWNKSMISQYVIQLCEMGHMEYVEGTALPKQYVITESGRGYL